jgi:hypothetical protein
MSEVRPLPIFPSTPLTPQRDALLRAAKASLDLPFKILPSPAAPAGPARVLAFGVVPDFMCEFVYIRAENVDRLESVRGALEACLTAPAGHPGVITEEQWMSAVMGVEVRLVAIEPLVKETVPAPSVRFY